jgi:hypothetical protein
VAKKQVKVVAMKEPLVTPIPSYVNIGDGIVEISPLPVDRSSCMAKTKPAVARRGLFGGGSESPIKSKNKVVGCVVVESTKKPAAQKKKMYAKSSTFAGIGKPQKPTTITPGLKKNAPSTPPPATTIANASHTAKIARRNVVVESKKPPAMKQPLLQFPRPKPANHASKEGTRKPLKEVYEDEVKKAKKFMDDVIGARADDIIVDESKENKSVIMDEKKKPPS